MTNTIFGLLSLLFVVAITTLWLSCNRNNTKTETNTVSEKKDTLSKTSDTLSRGIADKKQEDSIAIDVQEDSTASIIIDTTQNEDLSLKEKNSLEGTQSNTEDKSATDFKENINKPETKSSGGIKAAGNINDVLSNNTLASKIIVIGSGGGVTGAVTTYELYEDGTLYENSSLNLDISQKKMNTLKGMKEIQNQFDALNIDTIKLNAPGNMYFFVGYQKDGESHRCTWGANDVQAPENLRTFYENLMETISKNQ